MTSIVCYRQPGAKAFVRLEQTVGSPEELSSLTQLNGKEGFIIAPFTPDGRYPIVLVHPDCREEMAVEEVFLPRTDGAAALFESDDATGRADYEANFRQYHQRLVNGEFEKIVLARCEEVRCGQHIGVEELFMRACRLYPQMFVVLVATPLTGTWLMATPEILLRGNGAIWQTMALAGTMRGVKNGSKVGENDVDRGTRWSDKNIREQKIVADYILASLSSFITDILVKGPYTTQAADLLHLRSDFSFRLHDKNTIGSLLETLHPTPAVCGLPKQEVQRFIMQNEHSQRAYYSGFVGELHPSADTFLYVTLRCMQVLEHKYRFFAGGGLLPDSTEQREWEETKAKMATMKRLFEI